MPILLFPQVLEYGEKIPKLKKSPGLEKSLIFVKIFNKPWKVLDFHKPVMF